MIALVPVPDGTTRVTLLDGTVVTTLRDEALARRCVEWLLSLPVDWTAGAAGVEQQLLASGLSGVVAQGVAMMQNR